MGVSRKTTLGITIQLSSSGNPIPTHLVYDGFPSATRNDLYTFQEKEIVFLIYTDCTQVRYINWLSLLVTLFRLIHLGHFYTCLVLKFVLLNYLYFFWKCLNLLILVTNYCNLSISLRTYLDCEKKGWTLKRNTRSGNVLSHHTVVGKSVVALSLHDRGISGFTIDSPWIFSPVKFYARNVSANGWTLINIICVYAWIHLGSNRKRSVFNIVYYIMVA